MKSYEVKITDEALHDMDSIYQYISDVLLAPTNALSRYNRIADAIISLSHYPKRYQLFDVEPEHSMGIHRMVVDNYLVCYVVELNAVIVTSACSITARLRLSSENQKDFLLRRHFNC